MLQLVLALIVLFSRDCPEVSPVQKKEFLSMLEDLPTAGEFFAEEGIAKAAPYTRVLFALTPKDIEQYSKDKGVQQYDLYPFHALSRGLLDRKEQRDYSVRHFSKIAHPEIKLFWAAVLFDKKAASPEVIKFLRAALVCKDQSRILSKLLGPEFEEFKNRMENFRPKE